MNKDTHNSKKHSSSTIKFIIKEIPYLIKYTKFKLGNQSYNPTVIYHDNIKMLREYREMTHKCVAEIMECEPSKISTLETNREIPSKTDLNKLSQAFSVPVHILKDRKVRAFIANEEMQLSTDIPSLSEQKAYWEDSFSSIHDLHSQIQRQNAALKLEPFFQLDKENGWGVYDNSKEVYRCTLVNCTCTDNHVSKKPCKHMYKLADELELMKLEHRHIDKPLSQWQADYHLFKLLPDNKDLFIDLISARRYSLKARPVTIKNSEYREALINSIFVKQISVDPIFHIQKLTSLQLRQALKAKDITASSSLTRRRLINLIMKNISLFQDLVDTHVTLALHDEYDYFYDNMYNRLTKEYTWFERY